MKAFAKEKRMVATGAAGTWPADACDSYIARRGGALRSDQVISWASSNATLLSYLYESDGGDDVRTHWHAMTRGCRVVPQGCWCFHVPGSMVKADNPRGAKQCAPKDRVLDCTNPSAGPFFVKARRNCSCFAQAPSPAPPCLFGDMRPAKLLAIIAACRAAGVTHIIEQGRYGGLSAYMYHLHGFKVTSVELLPLSEVSHAMRALAPAVAQVDADGREAVARSLAGLEPARANDPGCGWRVAVPSGVIQIGLTLLAHCVWQVRLVRDAPAGERLAVIFDGEKRQTAYATFELVRRRIALAAFDDTNLDDGGFPSMLRHASSTAPRAARRHERRRAH